jgi:hypothetical protein
VKTSIWFEAAMLALILVASVVHAITGG